MTYDDSSIPIHCPCCDLLEEGIEAVADHMIAEHQYTLEEAERSVRAMADKFYEDNQ